MIVSLYVWGGVQRAERCHGCLSCSQCRPLQTWLILCSAVNRIICLWAASELISAKHHFLEDGEEMFPAGYKSASREMNRVPAPGSLGFCLRLKVWWQPSWISGGLWWELCWSSTVINIYWKLSSHGSFQKRRASFLCGAVLFALSRGSRRQQPSVCSAELLAAVSWTDADAELSETSKTLPNTSVLCLVFSYLYFTKVFLSLTTFFCSSNFQNRLL